jgi:hypothetical protein
VADLNLCETRCREEYGNPCEKFCPAAVYEMVPKSSEAKDGLRLQINRTWDSRWFERPSASALARARAFLDVQHVAQQYLAVLEGTECLREAA